MATVQDNLATIKANYVLLLAEESAYQRKNGPKPSYSLDGESMQWESWRQMMLDKIETINRLIQQEDGAFEIRSIGHI